MPFFDVTSLEFSLSSYGTFIVNHLLSHRFKIHACILCAYTNMSRKGFFLGGGIGEILRYVV